VKSRKKFCAFSGAAGEYRQALEKLPASLGKCFPLLRRDQRQEVEALIASYYLINQSKGLRETARQDREGGGE